MEISLSLEAQNVFYAYQYVVFALSNFLNALSMYCLIKKTPPNQTGIRPYFVFIQLIVIFYSLYLDILTKPIPLFPALAGYCNGLLCTAGIPLQALLGIAGLKLVLLGSGITFCSFHRHQTILPISHPFRLRKATFHALEVILCLCVASVVIAYVSIPFDNADPIKMLDQTPFNISWAVSRGPMIIHKKDVMVIGAVVGVNAGLFLLIIVLLLLLFHGVRSLNSEANRSRSAIKSIRNSAIAVFIQTAMPIPMILCPIFMCSTSLLCECGPYGLALLELAIVNLYPIAHNITLLSTNPAYRRFITTALKPCLYSVRATDIRQEYNSISS